MSEGLRRANKAERAYFAKHANGHEVAIDTHSKRYDAAYRALQGLIDKGYVAGDGCRDRGRFIFYRITAAPTG